MKFSIRTKCKVHVCKAKQARKVISDKIVDENINWNTEEKKPSGTRGFWKKSRAGSGFFQIGGGGYRDDSGTKITIGTGRVPGYQNTRPGPNKKRS